MRFVFALLLVTWWVTPAHAFRDWDPDLDCDSGQGYGPRRGEHPVRGVVFIGAGWTQAPRWIRGHGEVRERRLPLKMRRLDYVASEGAVLEVGDALYSIAGNASTFPRPTRVSMAVDPRCPSIVITVDVPLAAIKARMTRGDRIEDYWLVGIVDRYELFPVNDGATFGGSTLELFAVYPDGSERRLTMPIVVGTIPHCDFRDQPWSSHEVCQPGEHVAMVVPDEESRVQVRAALAVILWFLALGVLVRGAPAIAIHGLTMRRYLAKLRIRIRLPRARVLRRRA
jgi:hypothetical protein